MWHILKYSLLTLALFGVLNLFVSNADLLVSLNFKIPYILNYKSLPIPVAYLLLVSFCVGILVAAFIGAFRWHSVRGRLKEAKALEKNFKNQQYQPQKIEELPALKE